MVSVSQRPERAGMWRRFQRDISSSFPKPLLSSPPFNYIGLLIIEFNQYTLIKAVKRMGSRYREPTAHSYRIFKPDSLHSEMGQGTLRSSAFDPFFISAGCPLTGVTHLLITSQPLSHGCSHNKK